MAGKITTFGIFNTKAGQSWVFTLVYVFGLKMSFD